VFWVNLPIGVFGTSGRTGSLKELASNPQRPRIDWLGNLT